MFRWNLLAVRRRGGRGRDQRPPRHRDAAGRRRRGDVSRRASRRCRASRPRSTPRRTPRSAPAHGRDEARGAAAEASRRAIASSRSSSRSATIAARGSCGCARAASRCRGSRTRCAARRATPAARRPSCARPRSIACSGCSSSCCSPIRRSRASCRPPTRRRSIATLADLARRGRQAHRGRRPRPIAPTTGILRSLQDSVATAQPLPQGGKTPAYGYGSASQDTVARSQLRLRSSALHLAKR